MTDQFQREWLSSIEKIRIEKEAAAKVIWN